jgi:16S rRNA (guanine527-N7)-methyltransferase
MNNDADHDVSSEPLQPITPPPDFAARLATLDVELEPGDAERLGRFLAMLLDANTRFNLTAITDAAAAWERHVFDTLTLLPLIDSIGARTLIDVGSGGGVPGVPLAIALPALEVTLLEATGKKARFLESVVAGLGLERVRVVAERAETAARDRERHRETYDVVTARAVGPLPTLLELTVPFAREGGVVLAIKGERAGEEVEAARAALHVLHARVIDQRRTPTGTIVVIEKQRRTPKRYPRRPGEPKRDPIRNR